MLEPIEIMGVDAFGESEVVIKARIKTLPIEQWSVGREYRRRLKMAFDRENIEIPIPSSDLVYGRSQSALAREKYCLSDGLLAERLSELPLMAPFEDFDEEG